MKQLDKEIDRVQPKLSELGQKLDERIQKTQDWLSALKSFKSLGIPLSGILKLSRDFASDPHDGSVVIDLGGSTTSTILRWDSLKNGGKEVLGLVSVERSGFARGLEETLGFPTIEAKIEDIAMKEKQSNRFPSKTSLEVNLRKHDKKVTAQFEFENSPDGTNSQFPLARIIMTSNVPGTGQDWVDEAPPVVWDVRSYSLDNPEEVARALRERDQVIKQLFTTFPVENTRLGDGITGNKRLLVPNLFKDFATTNSNISLTSNPLNVVLDNLIPVNFE